MNVSVIIPVYNRERLLPRAIRSVLTQPAGDIELLVVDDGSSDGSLAIAQDYASSDPRVKVLNQSNQGVSSARNSGLREARGDWVALLDSDDEWAPDRLLHVRRLIEERPELDFVHGDRLVLRPDGSEDLAQRRTMTDVEGADVGWLLKSMRIKTSTVLVRRRCLEEMDVWFDERLRTCEDYEFFWRLVARAKKIAYDPVPRVICHDTPGSLTKQDRRPQLRDHIRARASVLRWIEQGVNGVDLTPYALDGLLGEISTGLRHAREHGLFSLLRELAWCSRHVGLWRTGAVVSRMADRTIRRNIGKRAA
ncbi:glycosyltransferase involved in cell wall biosynthesis [Natronocella acetinitrilica]|uniref:Glycosyltransferase involved in cell wall biosynthesis n=1 Tax=Natronocella acetinitrilica TaxID=414046 RepID=A0AAE3GBB3_9GAMM|nr:glycosyltransferase [Natronocella acetinitrilica]MCP1677142.1 glycosyltransferase involved in cell wall biosynthesis [Natronocella acetinitrilica]